MSNYRSLLNTVEAALLEIEEGNGEAKTGEELRELINQFSQIPMLTVDTESIENIALEIESKHGIKAGLGAVVDGKNFEPWLDDAKASIEPFYWDRYKKLLLRNGLPKDVVTSTDRVTEKILGRLGNPLENKQWDRRGMVVGHVQSGKTANYTGLICKAADAGYRLIIVIAGIHNNLRDQTQKRIDEGFIGRDTGRLTTSSKSKATGSGFIGVGRVNPNNTPVSLTNTLKDFNKATASTNNSGMDAYKVPVVLVIKKNSSTLKNLIDWLQENNSRGDSKMVHQPMLLIDDEADNASINTKYSKSEVTKINSQIRDLLKTFHRCSYVGYTATPFANIFIDPDNEDEVLKEDLFPKDFIIGLDAPSNYFGPKKVFLDVGVSDDGEKESLYLREIHDNENFLPVKHKKNYSVEALPPSLLRALRVFLLARTIRNLRGQADQHCSMLVNSSRFTGIQGQIRNRLHEALDRIINAVRVNANNGEKSLDDFEMRELHKAWVSEYSSLRESWEEIQSTLLSSIASAKVVEVNSRANELDYEGIGDKGKTLIAVGGFSLSRGLTLEGLTTTWFLRNTQMYDTLMQMGRWFGYRNKYEDLCRIWMPEKAIGWYTYIASATIELHQELKSMESHKSTPNEFGLAVRSHPASLLVTARNKLGSGKKVVTSVGLSNKFTETARISSDPAHRAKNIVAAQTLISTLSSKPDGSWKSGYLYKDVSIKLIDDFLFEWENILINDQTDPVLVRKYLDARKESELSTWDVLISGKQNGYELSSVLGIPVYPVTRSISSEDLKDSIISIGGSKRRVSSKGIEKAGLDENLIKSVEEKYYFEYGSKDYPDHIYREVRKKPLFILHLINFESKGKSSIDLEELLQDMPVVAWSISLPESTPPGKKVEYVVNTTRYAELFGEEEPGDEDE
ncbi:Z1 domain-containing protein [Cobetia marina]|uniref:Z1 domain-containing protein n=1 Tax=Cobetia marina TaxID=28258 RepID=UPI001143A2F7|nr:Z1 domain-containing protein [Cobetia marina]GED42431.1 endonuclease [Cobetia marina]